VALTVTEVIVGGGTLTVTIAVPDTFVYPLWPEVALIVAVPAPDGVNTPEELITPSVADQLTAELKAPVPVTVGIQADVWAVVIVAGEHATVTDVTVGRGVTVIVPDPETFV
jgi:hypothetical protein